MPPTGALSAAPVGCVVNIPTAQSLVGGVYEILHDPQHASAVNAPLIRSADFVTARSSAMPTTDGGTVLPLGWGSGGTRPPSTRAGG